MTGINSLERKEPWLTSRIAFGLTPARLVLVGILLLAVVLNFANLEAIGDSNQYYTAAVKSMLDSWQNFFYVSAEPGGSVSVDKPPLGLWIEAISAAIFGVSGLATVLPNILAGFGSILLSYNLVHSRYTVSAGLITAAAVAVAPVAIATQRNNTSDSMLTFLLLVAAWGFLKATETDRTRYLWIGALFVGLGFMIKMLQAYLILPALFAVYFLGSGIGFGRKVRNLAIATGIILVVSLWWPLTVDLTPADLRPYVGSSTNNTVMELIVGHNGASRIFGVGNSNDSVPGNVAMRVPPFFDDIAAELGVTSAELGDAVGFPPDFVAGESALGISAETIAAAFATYAPAPPGGVTNSGAPRDGGQPGGAPGGSEEVGEQGALRFFEAPLSKEISWLLPFALIGLALLAFGSRFTLPLSRDHQMFILFGGWLTTGLVFFSIAGFFHAYYLIMLVPPLGILVGITFVRLRDYPRPVGTALLITAVTLTVAWQWFNAAQFSVNAWWQYAAVALLMAGAIGLLLRQQRVQMAGLTLLLTSMLITPTAWAWQTNQQNGHSALPSAWTGNRMGGNFAGDGGRGPAEGIDAETVAWLQANTQDVEYLIAVSSSMIGAPLVLETGRPVLYMGGFNGSDPVVDASDLAQLVADGDLRYVFAGGDRQPGGGGDTQNTINEWVTTSCTAVTAISLGNVGTLYDCD